MDSSQYWVTEIPHTRIFPTYQLRARTTNDSLQPQTILNICVLETMFWLRMRLSNFSDLPEEIMLPDPDDYKNFDKSLLKSFSVNIGCTIEAVWSEQIGAWALRLEEADAGVNLGTDRERLPASGRKFETNIAFRIINNSYVECGFKTICSEPDNTTEYCEVFRPAVVKALYNNKNVGLRHILNITGEPFNIAAAKDLSRLKEAAANPERELPIVLITIPAAVCKQKPVEPENAKTPETDRLRRTISISEYLKRHFIEIDCEALGIEVKRVKKTITEKFEKGTFDDALASMEKPEMVVPETVDIDRLSFLIASFAIMCTVPDENFESVRSAFCKDLSKGDILILYNDGTNSIITFKKIAEDRKAAGAELRNAMNLYPKYRSIKWGNVLFAADIRLLDLQSINTERLSDQEKIKLLEDKNRALTDKLNEAEALLCTARSNEDEIRNLKKKNSALEQELAQCRTELEEKSKDVSIERAKLEGIHPTLNFYKKKSQDAALFPTDKDSIPVWAERNFNSTIFLHRNAVAALKKYVRPLNIEILCDGLYFLHGYALYRQGKISESELSLYSEEYGWEVQGCGKETIKMYSDDYSITMGKEEHQLKYHIKYGVSPTNWIRIYFYYDKEINRVVVGFMPDHLRTLSDKT